MLESVLWFYVLNLISFILCILLIILLVSQAKNRVIIAICLVSAVIHLICLCNWIFFDGDSSRITASWQFCWFQGIFLQYLGLVIHCLVLCTVLELWIVLRGSCKTIRQIKSIEEQQQTIKKGWGVPSLERPSTYYYSTTSPIVSSRLLSTLKFLRSWKGFLLSLAVPLITIIPTIIVLALNSSSRIESTHTMCMIVAPRWIMLFGFSILSIMLMLPLVFLAIHLVYIIFYARKHGSEILVQHSITLSVCIRMIILSLGITLISAVVDVWTLVGIIFEPYELQVDSAVPIPADLHDFTVATLGVIIFVIFGTSYDITRLYVNPFRRLFGLETLPPASPA